MNRQQILDAAHQCITVDRAATHGDAEDSFAEIACVWNWWLSERLTGPITPYDVAKMMKLFKDARSKKNPFHLDNSIDSIGYEALAGEIAANMARDA